MKRLVLLASALGLLLFGERPAQAGEVQLDGAARAIASTWRGDYGGGGQLRLGYRFAKVLAVDFVGWEEYASVDRRLDTGITLGLTGFLPLGRVRPSLRLYFIHQHEEGLVSVEDHAGGTILGIGEGIRHRAGGGAVLGAEIALAKSTSVEYLAVAGATVTLFPDTTLGPGAYFGFTAGLGLNYSLPGLP